MSFKANAAASISRGRRYLPDIALRKPFDLIKGVQGTYRLPKGKNIRFIPVPAALARKIDLQACTSQHFGGDPLDCHFGYIGSLFVAFFANVRLTPETLLPCVGVVKEFEGMQIGRLLLGLTLAQAMLNGGGTRNILAGTAVRGFMKDLDHLAPLLGHTNVIRRIDAIEHRISVFRSDTNQQKKALKAIEKYLESAGICRIA